MNIYFPSLNGVRFIAAFMVIVSHLELFKKKAAFEHLHDNNIMSQIGHQGVKVFFVLSGFLITFLLLKEKEKIGSIMIRKFYMRRILRIWPLYFLIVTLSFFVLPYLEFPEIFTHSVKDSMFSKLLLYIFMLPNLALYIFGSMFGIGVLWSIGAEEQFYMIWPHLVKFSKNIIVVLVCMLILVVVAKSIGYYLWREYIDFGYDLRSVGRVIYLMLPFDSMIIGAITASVFFQKKKILEVLYSKQVQLLSYVFVLILFLIKPSMGPLEGMLYSVLYAVIILNLSTNTKTIVNLENKVLNKLGQISYGIYMYHTIFIGLFLGIFYEGLANNDLIENIKYYFFSISLSLLTAYLSYKYLESRILKLKRKFMVVKSIN